MIRAVYVVVSLRDEGGEIADAVGEFHVLVIYRMFAGRMMSLAGLTFIIGSDFGDFISMVGTVP